MRMSKTLPETFAQTEKSQVTTPSMILGLVSQSRITELAG
uniref:Uncharacterized protein n=1 Tax=Anguilla anguilla TaxID=7936 RepID=A0A0E9WF03_ANGAN